MIDFAAKELHTAGELLRLRRAGKKPALPVWLVHDHWQTGWLLGLQACVTGNVVVVASLESDLSGFAGLDVVLHEMGATAPERFAFRDRLADANPKSIRFASSVEETERMQAIAVGLEQLRNAGLLRADGKLVDEEDEPVTYAEVSLG